MKLIQLRYRIAEEVLPVEYIEPTGKFTYAGREYPYWGSITGRSSTEKYELGKLNRYAQLGDIADEVVKDLSNTIKNNPDSIEGRCAYACLIMMVYGVRVGNEDSAEGYESGMEQNLGELIHTYGTTTLLNSHISFKEEAMFLNFIGKEQVKHDIRIDDSFLRKYGKMFWKPEKPTGKWLNVDYSTIFDFIKDKVGSHFIPKDFRTFCANTTGWRVIERYLDKPKHFKKRDAKKEVATVVELTARRLRNTPGIAKRNYLDHRMLDWFLGQRWSNQPT